MRTKTGWVVGQATVVSVALLFMCGAARAATNYVWTDSGSPNPPYDTWATAAHDIQTAVDYASTNYPAYDTVLVTNGNYAITTQLAITNGISVRSVNGAEQTIIRRLSGDIRVVLMTHADAALDGFTVRDGRAATQGGGIYMTGGFVRNCVITNNITFNQYGYGGGVYMVGGVLSNSVVCNNTMNGVNSNQGGGIRMSSGALATHCVIYGNKLSANNYANYGAGAFLSDSTCILRNCLVYKNDTVSGAPGGGVYGGTVESCTVVANINPYGSGGGTAYSIVSDSIVYGNSGVERSVDNYSGGSFTNSCSLPLPAGTGNTNADPAFVNAAANNFRLLPGSPCLDTGILLDWMSPGGVDLDGNARVYNSLPDIGAYELTPGALACNFSSDSHLGAEPLPVVFTAYVSGTNTDSLYYRWDFENDAIVNEEGLGKAVVTNTFNAGVYVVSLTVSNAAGETAEHHDNITVTKTTLYVAQGNSGAAAPYTSWATAAATIPAALSYATDGTEVLVSNGVYNVSYQTEITAGVTVRSVNGATNTTVKRTSGAYRLFRLAHPNAVLDGFTVSGGYANGVNGLGINMTGGLVRNCIITNNTSSTHNPGEYGLGVYMNGGVISNCVVVNNGSQWNNTYGSGIYMSNGALVTHSIIAGNYNSSGWISDRGVAILMSDASCLVRNCLIYGNRATGASYGYVILRGRMESCTVVANVGGGVQSCAVTNSIVYFNTYTNGAVANNNGSSFTYSCVTPLPAGIDNIDDEPVFVNSAQNDYRLQHVPERSPGIDAGLDLPWMLAVGATDLAGQPRIGNKHVDIGAYETYVPPKGTAIEIR